MDLIGRVNQNFHENINATQVALDVMASGLVSAAETMTQSLLGGGKIITCGCGRSSAIAQYMTSLLLGRLQLPRPPLPSICLSSNTVISGLIARDSGHAHVFASQLSALGHHGDTLLLINDDAEDMAMMSATREAHDRDIRVVLLAGEHGDELSTMLNNTDIEITVPVENPLRVHEIQVLAAHCMCDLIDNQLLGNG